MPPAQWISMEVVEVRWETPELFHLRIAPVLEESRLDFQAGQCVKISCPDGREGFFAMANEPETKGFLEFLVKDQPGSVAHELCQAKLGDPIKISQPFGKGFPIERLKGKDILLIGIGSGLSALRSLLKSLLRREQQFGEITFLYGARIPEDIPYKSEFHLWAKKINLQIAVSQHPDPSGANFKGRVTQLIPKLPLRPTQAVACICGTKAMEEEVTKLLESVGISKDNILLNH